MKWFTEHPASVGETYFEHFVVAVTFFGKLLLAALACLMHAVFPFLFAKTGSRMVSDMYDRMVAQRGKRRVSSDTAESGG